MSVQIGGGGFEVGAERISRFEGDPLADGVAVGFVAYRLDFPWFEDMAGFDFSLDDSRPSDSGEPTPRGYYMAHFYTRGGGILAPLPNDNGTGQYTIMVALTAESPRAFNTDEQFRDLVRTHYLDIIEKRQGAQPPEGEYYTEQVAPPAAP